MLTLAKDGIFPVTRNAEGKLIPELPASGFPIPGTIQGEGKLNGIPSLFIRLAGCNLRCQWKNRDGSFSICDTAYASFHPEDTVRYSVEEISRIVYHNSSVIRHIVITGGEPLLQRRELIRLCRELKKIRPFHLTLETNATLYEEALTELIDFFSLSPKLSTSATSAVSSVSTEVIQNYIRHARKSGKDYQLKFVCSAEQDLEEIRTLLASLNDWENEDILLMPLGGTTEELQQNRQQVLHYCIQKGWRYCERLHLLLFGNKAGV